MPTKEIAIVFDMDGLMVDTEPLSHQAWDELLRPFNHQLDEETISHIIGRRAEASAQVVRDRFELPMTVSEIIERKGEIYGRIRAKGARVMPGLMELHQLIAHRQIPWAVATSSPRHEAQRTLQQLGLTEQCRAIAAGTEAANGKPAPDIYLLAAERLGIDPSHCLALEDSATGSQAAVAAGMLTIAIPNQHTKTGNFSHAQYQYNSLHDVVTNLDTLLAQLPHNNSSS